MQNFLMLIHKNPQANIQSILWKPVAFVDIPVKTTSTVKASSQANKQIYF